MPQTPIRLNSVHGAWSSAARLTGDGSWLPSATPPTSYTPAALQACVDFKLFITTGVAVSVDTLSTFHFRTYVRFRLSTGSAYHLVVISPDVLTQTRRVPQTSKPVLVMLELVPEAKPAAANAPALLSMKSVGEVQFPLLMVDEFVGSAVKDPSLAFCVTTEG